MSHSNLVCDWLFFHPLRVPSRGSLALWVFAVTGQACVSQRPRNLSEKLPKTIFRVSQSTWKVRASKTSRHFIPKSYYTGVRMLAKTFSGNLLAIKWQLPEHFF